MTNQKSKKKRTKLKKTAAKKKLVKKMVRKKLAKKKAAPNKKATLKKAAVKTKAPGKKAAGVRAAGALKKRVRVGSQNPHMEIFAHQGLRSQSAGQSGDLQGLSKVEAADSESVDELIEEGNAFEADVVAGVERAGDADETEVRTHEVPEDDVPGEYLDKE
jgi:hypothetical protein